MQDIKTNEKVLSPGMKYRHYAPNTHCKLIYGKENKNALIISSTENIEKYKDYKTIDMGSKNNLEEISHNIFSILRKIDSYDADIALIEGIEMKRIRPCNNE